MIDNIIFDFDGVIVDSEIIAGKAICKYLNERGINFAEEDLYQLSGYKTTEIISTLCSRFEIKDKDTFYSEIIELSNVIYYNDLKPVEGVHNFVKNIKCKKLIGSNNVKPRIIEGLKTVQLEDFFLESLIFAFDTVGIAKPKPDIYLMAIKKANLEKNNTLIIEDSVIGTMAGVAAGIKVIGLTAGGHCHPDRSKQELYDAGAFTVANDYKELLNIIEKL